MHSQSSSLLAHSAEFLSISRQRVRVPGYFVSVNTTALRFVFLLFRHFFS
jgi:hypothetical protein